MHLHLPLFLHLLPLPGAKKNDKIVIKILEIQSESLSGSIGAEPTPWGHIIRAAAH